MTAIAVGPENDGKDVIATVADTVAIRLPENPTSGVRWLIDRLEGPLERIDDYNEQPPPSAGIGAASLRVLVLRPTGPGSAKINLKRCQEWEQESTTDATFSCSIRIRE